MPQISAGLLMYRYLNKKLQFFLVHPGGPLFKNKDNGFWSIPKGLVEEGEDFLQTAIREFEEETGLKSEGPYIELGQVKLKSGKIVHGWGFQRKSEEEFIVKSNKFSLEWPPKSGRIQSFDEIDNGDFFALEDVKIKINESQFPFIERLIKYLNN